MGIEKVYPLQDPKINMMEGSVDSATVLKLRYTQKRNSIDLSDINCEMDPSYIARQNLKNKQIE